LKVDPIHTAYMRLALVLERQASREGLVVTVDAIVGLARELILANRKVQRVNADVGAILNRCDEILGAYGCFAGYVPGRRSIILRLPDSELSVPL
jgi:hypothetical protein